MTRSTLALALALLGNALFACGSGQGSTGATPVAPGGGSMSPAAVPSALALPVRLSDINLRGVINPFGVVRSSLDRGSVGHPGIDIPLNTGAPIFAVGDGRIVSVRSSVDSRPGSLVKVLLIADPTPGSGWVFLYEHVTLLGGLGVDSVVTRGQQIATNPLDPAFGNHMELAHVFNNFEFHENQTCWVNQLDGTARTDLVNRFNNQLRMDPRFVAAWQTVTFEGRLPFRQLLDATRHPEGAQLCYPPGTDERIDP